MEKEIKDLEGVAKEMTVTLEKDEVEPHFNKAYQEAQPGIQMEGFRKGKVPIKTIKQFYGRQIEADAMNDIISEIFTNILREDKIPLVGEPLLEHTERNEDGGLEFRLRYEVMPEFELSDYKNLEVDEPVHAVSDEEIDEQVEQLCKHNGTFEVEQDVENEEFVVGIRIRELDEETGVPIIGKDPQEQHVYLADQTVTPELREQLIGSKLSDKFKFNPIQAEQHAPDKAYEIEIFDIQRLIPREFSNEFAKEYSKGKFETTEELREEIGFQLQEQWDQKSREAMEQQIVEKLVDANDFPLPKTIVRKVMEAMVEDIKKKYKDTPGAQNLTVEAMEEDLRPVAERNVKWEVIRSKIMNIEDITVEDHDIDPIAESEAKRRNSDKEAIKQQFMQNQNLINNILTQKVMELLKDFTTTNEMTFEEFDKKHGHHHDHDHDHDHGHDHDHDHGEEEGGKESGIITP